MMHLLRLTLHDRTTSPNSTIVARTVQGTSLSLTYSLSVPEIMPLPRLTYNLITNWALFNQLSPHFVLLSVRFALAQWSHFPCLNIIGCMSGPALALYLSYSCMQGRPFCGQAIHKVESGVELMSYIRRARPTWNEDAEITMRTLGFHLKIRSLSACPSKAERGCSICRTTATIPRPALASTSHALIGLLSHRPLTGDPSRRRSGDRSPHAGDTGYTGGGQVMMINCA